VTSGISREATFSSAGFVSAEFSEVISAKFLWTAESSWLAERSSQFAP
jgi:hypothetical protein